MIVRSDQVIAEAVNLVTVLNDPTAHAEVLAIRRACEGLRSFELRGCDLYTSCEPCPMCLGAIYWARLDRVFFGATHTDAAVAGFDDSFIYDQVPRSFDARSIPFQNLMRESALVAFDEWKTSLNKVPY